MFHEVAKAPAVSMSAAHFRHGPVEVVNPSFRSVIFGSHKATADLDTALARDILRMGGEVRWIGPPTPGLTAEPMCAWPSDVPELFAPLVGIAPLQFAAHHLAQWRGITPGEFRFATLVTRSETSFDTA